MSAFSWGIGRAIRSSLGRFLAIMGIVALGCGFFAGMRMGGPGMRAAADAYYDDAALCREIATLKVLGFRRGEVAAYVFREILVLALLGDALGLVLGTWLESFVIVTAEVDLVMFGRVIHPASYACAFVLTLVFAGLVMLAMRRKLDGVDMVESLKSVD